MLLGLLREMEMTEFADMATRIDGEGGYCEVFMLVAFVDERFGIPLGYGELNLEELRDDRGDRQVDRAKSSLGQLLA